MNKCSSNSSKLFLEVHLKYPKELRELLNYYLSAPDKIGTKKMLPDYQLKIADVHNVPIGNIKD